MNTTPAETIATRKIVTKKIIVSEASYDEGNRTQAFVYALQECVRSALGSIRAHGMRSFLTMLGIIIGVASVICVVALLQGLTQSEPNQKEIEERQSKGETVMFVVIDNQLAGYISVADPIKQNSKSAIKELQKQGLSVIMLTGDNINTAKSVADELNLSSYKASCLPEDKLNEIKRLQSEGKIVAMAGDGINDAPALAQADIGIAMGTGTDVAIESAKITLVKGDLQGIVKAKNLSHAVMRNINQNLFFAKRPANKKNF